MRKILFFALALVAGALAFTSCDKKDKNGADDPNAVVFNAVGELRGVMFPVHNGQQQAVITLHPNANTVDKVLVSKEALDSYISKFNFSKCQAHIEWLLVNVNLG